MASSTSVEAGFDQIPWRISDAVVLLAPLALVPPLRLVPNPPLWFLYTFSALPFVWMIGASLWLARRHAGGLPRPPSIKRIAIEIAIAIPLALWVAAVLGVAMWATTAILGEPVVASRQQLTAQAVVAAPDGWLRAEVLIIAVTVDPIAEQLAFCGVFFNALRRRMPVQIAAIVIAVPFALLRSDTLASAVATGLAGTAFAVAYNWRKQLVGAIAIHVFVNCIALLGARAAGPPPQTWIGVYTNDPEVLTRVTEVAPDSPAAAAGLQRGDVIRTIDGEAIDDGADLKATVLSHVPGEQVVVALERDGVLTEITVTLGGR